jgi:hypothetical protein
MRSPPWSIGMLMICMGGLAIAPLGGRAPAGPPAYALAALLVAGGMALFSRRPFGFWVALASAGLTVLVGVGALATGRAARLPLPPAILIGIGLYLCLRVLMARAMLRQPPPPRGDDAG